MRASGRWRWERWRWSRISDSIASDVLRHSPTWSSETAGGQNVPALRFLGVDALAEPEAAKIIDAGKLKQTHAAKALVSIFVIRLIGKARPAVTDRALSPRVSHLPQTLRASF